MPRSERIIRPIHTTTNNNSRPTSTTSPSVPNHTEPKRFWLIPFIQGVGAGLGHSIGNSLGKLIIAITTTGTSYILYRTRIGYKLATLVWKEERVNQFVYQSRLVGRILISGSALIGVSYIGYKFIQTVTWIKIKLSDPRIPFRNSPNHFNDDSVNGSTTPTNE